MTTAEAKRRQRQRHTTRPQADQAPVVAPRDYVLTFKQWCQLNGISKMTARRIIASGEGPPVLQLSPRRLGIRMSDNLRWQESRIRTASA